MDKAISSQVASSASRELAESPATSSLDASSPARRSRASQIAGPTSSPGRELA
ncbi:UNVERIFIED_CONTAM: hypothetical protein Slati_2698000 [Sesamum latifolium]|uniref:Uncharacterized protein n=1 Tax=Sesamum latifolium TaxID=2727402 RepID=A0AAW2W008_9LAMI